ncbi:hypothetical protein LCI18_013372 [Fusarium solani-melongenae]|uniref:Uncharacterized protein n=1 Tax=Fusarium solani subsp. cucurbitae TaxID=2747967 RepID=A0ACD3ZMK9_FUSSC|nr:hypothetical protein LCI18_013372 [Fusarium solani-melongenae]
MQESHPAVAVYRAMQTRPESEAFEIFRLIRAGADPETIMRQLTTADLLLQVHLVPESRYRYQFPYSSQMPAYLQSPNNGFMKSMVYEWNAGDNPRSSQLLSPNDEKFKAHYLKPFHAATIVDTRLAEIMPSRYTTVHADDGLMRTLLHNYFLQEYDWFTFFHKDFFLDDMIAGTGTFCSPLLVNAVLAVGCHCHTGLPHRTELWNPDSLGYQFLAEAKRLWEAEMPQERTLTTLQAGLVMNSIFSIYGMDRLASAYLVQATTIVNDLGLLDASTNVEDPRLRHSYNFTAWSFFHWQCILSYQFMTEPPLARPPRTAMPDPSHDPEWYGEIWLKYPSTEVLVPLQYRYVFKAKSDFSIILNSAIVKAYGADGKDGLVQRGAKQVEDILRGLKAWHNTLPDLLAPSNVVFPSQLKIHLHYYHVLIQLYELLVAEQGVGSPSLPLDTDHLQNTLAECRAFFETILRIYYLRHGFEHGNLMLIQYLAKLAFMALGKLKELSTSNSSSSPMDVGDSDPEAAKSTLLIAQKGLSDQGKSYYFPQTMSNIVLGHVSTEDPYLLQGDTSVEQETRGEAKKREEQLEGQCPLDVRDISKNPDQHQSENWIRQYAKLTLDETSYNTFLKKIPAEKG